MGLMKAVKAYRKSATGLQPRPVEEVRVEEGDFAMG